MTETLRLFDGGVAGNDIVAGVDGIHSIPDSKIPKYIAGYHPATGIRAGDAANTTNARFRTEVGIAGDHYGQIYMKYNTAHGSSGNYLIFLSWANSSNTIIASLRVGFNREFNIRVGASTVVRTGSANEIPLNAWFRLDYHVKPSTTDIFYELYDDPDAVFGTGLQPIIQGSIDVDSSSATRLILGPNSSNSMIKDFSYDTLRFTSVNYFDPYVPPAGPSYKVWNGSAEVAATAKIWNGSAEVNIGSTAIQ